MGHIYQDKLWHIGTNGDFYHSDNSANDIRLYEKDTKMPLVFFFVIIRAKIMFLLGIDPFERFLINGDLRGKKGLLKENDFMAVD